MHNASRYLQRVLETAGLTESLPHIDLPRPVGVWEVVKPLEKRRPDSHKVWYADVVGQGASVFKLVDAVEFLSSIEPHAISVSFD
jgi:hypothetical protein